MSHVATIHGKEVEVEYIEDLANGTDAQKKHTPCITPENGGLKVTIGNFGISHPQTEEHYIGWICVLDKDVELAYQEFGPEDVPELFVPDRDGDVCVIAWCNLHGAWEAFA